MNERFLEVQSPKPVPGRLLQAAGGALPAAPDVEVAVAEEEEERVDTPWRVILYNDDIHTFDEVIMQIIRATGCTTTRAEELAWTVHTRGKAAVYEGEFEDCLRVQGVLREIGLVTEIEG